MRRARLAHRQSEQLHRRLGPRREALPVQSGAEQVAVLRAPVEERERAVDVAAFARLEELAHEDRRNVILRRKAAGRPQKAEHQERGLTGGQQRKPAGKFSVHRLQVAEAGPHFFHADEARVGAQRRDHRNRNLKLVGRFDEERQRAGTGDPPHVLQHHGVRRDERIRQRHLDRIHASALGETRKVHCAVNARIADERRDDKAPAAEFHRRLDQLLPFFERQRRVLAYQVARDDSGHALGGEKIEHRGETRERNPARGIERGYYGRDAAAETSA